MVEPREKLLNTNVVVIQKQAVTSTLRRVSLRFDREKVSPLETELRSGSEVVVASMLESFADTSN
jgi:hypothetical protein